MCPARLQRRFGLLLVYMLLLAGGETAVVGLIAFYAAAVSDPQATFQLPLLHKLGAYALVQPLLASPRALIGLLSVLVIVAVPTKNIFRGFVVYRIARYSAALEAAFGQQLLSGILARDYRWHVSQNSADLVSIINWRHHLGREYVRPYLNLVCEMCMLVVMLGGLLLVQPQVSLLLIVVQGGAGVLVYRVLRRGLDCSASGCRNCEIAINRHITRAIHGVKDVKITATAPRFIVGFRQQAQRFAQLYGRQQFWRESPLLALESLGFVLIAGAILLMLFVLDYSPLKTTGTTALLAVAAWRTLPAFNRVLSSLTGIRTARPYVLSLLETLQFNYANTHDDGDMDVTPLPFRREISFNNVSFAYESDSAVLDNISFTLAKGQSLGIMGPSGCGKSTLVDLLCGLLLPDSGTIAVDGLALTRENVVAWRRNIGYVPQFPYIFDGTLAENVAFGVVSDAIDTKLVLQVCAMAGIDFLTQLPDGIYSEIGERGVRLSGGQRQRVAIARALYRKPELLIFDEATSALDEEKDAEIRRLLCQLKGEQTLVIISHRPSTVADCDMMLQMAAASETV